MNNIRTLVLCPVILRQMKWPHGLDEGAIVTLQLRRQSEPNCLAAYDPKRMCEEYDYLYEEQQRMLRDGALFDLLAGMIPRMAKLNRIVFRSVVSKIWPQEFSSMIIDWIHVFHTVNIGFPRFYQATIGNAKLEKNSLAFDFHCFDWKFIPDFQTHINPLDLQKLPALSVKSPLTNIQVNAASQLSLNEILSAAFCLTDLNLSFPRNQQFAPAPAAISVLGSQTWPQLRRLRLDGLILHESHMALFFARHSATLREISIGAARLIDDQNMYYSWRIFLQRTAEVLELEGFEGIEHNWNGGYAWDSFSVDVPHAELRRRTAKVFIRVKRVLRYLLLGLKTNQRGREDFLTRQSQENFWQHITWEKALPPNF